MQSYEWTGERLVTQIQDETATEHLHRYGLALNYCKDKKVVDIACGEGYGSSFLSNIASEVTGVDIDAGVVKFASEKYRKQNLKFKQGSAAQIPVEDNWADVVVSFETIEHHDQHEKMIREIRRILKPDGILIISTPDRRYYSDERNFKNQFHVKELTREEFELLLRPYFSEVCMLLQRISYGSLIIPEKNTPVHFAALKGDYSNITPLPFRPLYNIAICSNHKLEQIEAGFFDGSADMTARIQAVYNSSSYKLGYKLLQPFRALSSILKSRKK